MPLLPFQFCQHLRRDTVYQPLNVFQLAFQLCPFHRIFHLAFFAGFGSGFQLFIFRQKVVYRDLVFFELPREVLHLRKPLFQQGEGFLFLLSGIERGNTVQRGFNGSCLFGEIDRLLEQTGGDKDDFFSVPEDNPLEDFLQTAEETAKEDSDPEQAALAFICKRLKLNLKKLSEEEKKWLKKIAQKSDLLKNPNPQRGRK